MSLDKTLKAIGLRKKTPADKVREAGASLNARFAKLRGATPESRARAAGARYGLDKRPVVLAALWIFAALPWFNARWTGSVTPAGLAPLVLGQALSMQDKVAESFTGMLGSKLWEQADGVRSVAGVAAFGRYALPMAVCLGWSSRTGARRRPGPSTRRSRASETCDAASGANPTSRRWRSSSRSATTRRRRRGARPNPRPTHDPRPRAPI